ncbi:hypothetical protein HYQ46_009808 [Verticillium longisporum]|nr:hypothetical protein HYQ46_009808 [Verticillium longisporum]
MDASCRCAGAVLSSKLQLRSLLFVQGIPPYVRIIPDLGSRLPWPRAPAPSEVRGEHTASVCLSSCKANSGGVGK